MECRVFLSEKGKQAQSGFIIGEIIYGVVGKPTAGGARLQVGSNAADTHVELGSELTPSPFSFQQGGGLPLLTCYVKTNICVCGQTRSCTAPMLELFSGDQAPCN